MEKPTNYVAAIDFGTCNTRMAYAKKPKILNKRLGPEDITVMTDWESSPGIDRTAPTTILIDRKGGIFYGYEAEETMSNLTEDDLRKCFFVRNFKMELHEREVRLVLMNVLLVISVNQHYAWFDCICLVALSP